MRMATASRMTARPDDGNGGVLDRLEPSTPGSDGKSDSQW